MPRVDKGWKAVDISTIIEYLDRRGDAGLSTMLKWVTSRRTILVTSPSTIIAEYNSSVSRVTLGIGSFLVNDIPPLRHFIVHRPEWVEGCTINPSIYASLPRIHRSECSNESHIEIDGTIVAIDTRDIVSLLINGLKARVRLCHVPGSIEAYNNVKAVIDGHPILVYDRGKYYILFKNKNIELMIRYITSMIGLCES
ncbi:MAG: hypothetical protein F7C81_01515 [Desulfurococcales archaeon]|nr:hypothetical protein [Desulfurococcales archaeon]